jgi:hypothetical protein
MEHNIIQAEVDRAISVRVGGIEKQLDEVRVLLTRMVLIEERQSNYKADNETLRKDVNKLFDQVRILQTTTAVQETNGKNTDQILWKVISGILALGMVVIEFFRR